MRGFLTSFLIRQRYHVVAPYIHGEILDLGCGFSPILRWLSPDQAYIGIEKRLPIYQKLVQEYPSLQFHNLDLDKQDLPILKRFDTILMMAIIEHLADPGNILRQIPERLKDGGRLLITTPTPLGSQIHQLGSIFNIFSQTATEEHIEIFTFHTLKPMLQANRLKIIQYKKFLLGGNQLFVCSA